MKNKLHKHSLTMGLVDSELSVSQEGMLGDMVGWVRDLFKYRPADHAKLIEKALGKGSHEIESVGKLRKLIIKCFLDDRWLNSHELVEGDVSGTFIAPAITFGDEPLKDPFRSVFVNSDIVITEMSNIAVAAVAHANYIRKRYDTTLSESRGLISLIRSEMRRRKAQTTESTESSVGVSFLNTLLGDVIPATMIAPKVERLVRELKHSSTAYQLSPAHYWDSKRPNYSLYKRRRESGGYKARVIRAVPFSHDAPTLPALNREQIKHLAQLVLGWLDNGYLDSGKRVLSTIMTAKSGNRYGWGSVGTREWDPTAEWDPQYGREPTDEEIFWHIAVRTADGRELKDLVSKSSLLINWSNGSEIFETLQHPTIAIIHWMSASIKGRLSAA